MPRVQFDRIEAGSFGAMRRIGETFYQPPEILHRGNFVLYPCPFTGIGLYEALLLFLGERSHHVLWAGPGYRRHQHGSTGGDITHRHLTGVLQLDRGSTAVPFDPLSKRRESRQKLITGDGHLVRVAGAVWPGDGRDTDDNTAGTTGGTSLVPCVRRLLVDIFDGRAELRNPFEAVSRGACRGVVVPILQHDYAIESYNAQRQDYEFKPMFRVGTEYPTCPDAVRLWARGSYEGMTRIGLKIFEVSRMKARRLDLDMVDADGALKDESRVVTEFDHICLNRDNPTFIVAVPPVNLQRDTKRFICSFQVDGHRRLLLTVLDNLSRKTLLKDHPVVRL
jgi:hypothetical protein